MLAIRERKILSEIVSHRGRSLLVILSIMIGVFGVVLMVSTADIITTQLNEDINTDALAMTRLYVNNAGEVISNEENLAILEALKANPDIVETEGLALYPISWKTAEGAEFNDGNIMAFSSGLEEARLEGPSQLVEGRYPVAGQREIAVEQRFATEQGVAIGDVLVFRTGTDAGVVTTQWTIVGTLFSPYFAISPAFGGTTGETLPQERVFAHYNDAQEIARFNGLTAFYVRYTDIETARAQLDALKSTLLAETQYVPGSSWVEDPDENTLITQISQLAVVLGTLAVIAMIVSGFLVTNVINTVIVEQKRQIGVLKALGASRWDTIYIYAGMALVYGIIATSIGTLIAIPLAAITAQELGTVLYTLVEGGQVSALGIITGVLMGVLVPLLAVLIPVINGTRVTILEAMTDLGISSEWGRSRASRFIGHLPLPQTIVQAISNVYQKKGRLALTGLTLTLAIGTFMGVTALFVDVGATLNTLWDSQDYDIVIRSQQAQALDTIEVLVTEAAAEISGVYPGYSTAVGIEGYASNDPLNPNSNVIMATGIDPASPIIAFDLVEGSGWQADPQREGVVISEPLASDLEKGVGDVLNLDINGTQYSYSIIGIDSYAFPILYIAWDRLALAAGYVDEDGNPLTSTFYLRAGDEPDIDAVDALIDQIEPVLLENGVQAVYINQPASAEQQALALSAFLAIFNLSSVLMALVGAVGLLAALSMAVIERQKEIGVMRSVGARARVIMSQFLTEGILVALLAWLFALPLAVATGDGLAATILQNQSLEFSFPPSVFLIGLIGILIVAVIASAYPSRAASRRTVSEILRYQ